MSPYIHELSDWPHFFWDEKVLSRPLGLVRHRQGKLIGRMEALGFPLRVEAVLRTLTLDIVESGEIEGVLFDKQQVRSSIARQLGVDIGNTVPANRNVEGVVEMMLDATRNYDKPLTKDRLFAWHSCLFPTGRSGMNTIKVSAWRDDSKGSMQVVSGAVGHERVHFEAPAANRLESEMAAFLDWFNADDGTDLVLRAGIAHLWFVTIHPFDDGNGRIARAIADMILARSEGNPQRFYSMSAQIRSERDTYYRILEETQQGTLDITPYLEWFLDCLHRTFDNVDSTIGTVLKKASFWDTHEGEAFNDRQRLMLNRLLENFEGKLTSTKWAKLAKCSQDTALRDIIDLVTKEVLVKDPGGGRSTSYSLRSDTAQ
ncbi:MAG: Fic family protein [Syntrophorhabdaceae bacterium]|nr:Fic family protein [Syntrophorhabdaceae bacterium]